MTCNPETAKLPWATPKIQDLEIKDVTLKFSIGSTNDGAQYSYS